MRKLKQRRKNDALLSLGEAVRNRRVDLLLTQEQVAENAELHRTYVTDIEGGLRNLSFLTLLRLARALRCPLSKIIIDTEQLNGNGNKAHTED